MTDLAELVLLDLFDVPEQISVHHPEYLAFYQETKVSDLNRQIPRWDGADQSDMGRLNPLAAVNRPGWQNVAIALASRGQIHPLLELLCVRLNCYQYPYRLVVMSHTLLERQEIATLLLQIARKIVQSGNATCATEFLQLFEMDDWLMDSRSEPDGQVDHYLWIDAMSHREMWRVLQPLFPMIDREQVVGVFMAAIARLPTVELQEFLGNHQLCRSVLPDRPILTDSQDSHDSVEVADACLDLVVPGGCYVAMYCYQQDTFHWLRDSLSDRSYWPRCTFTVSETTSFQ